METTVALCEIRTQLQELTKSVESCQSEVSEVRLESVSVVPLLLRPMTDGGRPTFPGTVRIGTRTNTGCLLGCREDVDVVVVGEVSKKAEAGARGRQRSGTTGSQWWSIYNLLGDINHQRPCVSSDGGSGGVTWGKRDSHLNSPRIIKQLVPTTAETDMLRSTSPSLFSSVHKKSGRRWDMNFDSTAHITGGNSNYPLAQQQDSHSINIEWPFPRVSGGS